MNQKLIVHAISRYFYPVTAGIETNMLETYRYLAAQYGWQVTIHTTADTYFSKNCLPKNEKIKGLTVKRYPCHWYSFWPNIDWQGMDVIVLHNFDVVPHLWLLLYCSWLKLTGQKTFKLLLTPHGGFTPEWRSFQKVAALIKQIYHHTLGMLLINTVLDGVRAVSEWEKQAMIDRGVDKTRITVIANGIEDEAYLDVTKRVSQAFKKQVEAYKPYIIQVGRIYHIKNYETTIRALALLPKTIHYVIAGSVQGPDGQAYLEYLQNLIREKQLEKRVHFVGVVRGVDKYYLMKKAQLMVHMALWESFCNVVHEGMSQGLIPVVANNTNLRMLVKHNQNGYCVETSDHTALAKRLEYVLKKRQTKKLKEMRYRNKKQALQHSWSAIAQQVFHWTNQIIFSQSVNTSLKQKLALP